MEDYLEQHNISAILKGLVMQLCVQKPDLPIEFMMKYLADNYLKKERMASRQVDEYDDRIDMEMNEREAVEPETLKRKRRGAICCETPKVEQNVIREVIPKDQYTQLHLENALKRNIMFSHLEDDQRRAVFGAMFEIKFKAGDTIIHQGTYIIVLLNNLIAPLGDEGDNFYVVDAGECDVFVSKQGSPPAHVASYSSGGAFGELALISGSPRAATVKVRLIFINF